MPSFFPRIGLGISLSLSIGLLGQPLAQAAEASRVPPPKAAPAPLPPPPPLPASGAPDQKQLTAALSVDDGGLAVGADFDFVDSPNEKYGAYTRLFGKDSNKGQAGLFALGANFKGHAKVGLFDYYIAPGFGLLQHSLRKTELLFGPTLAIGLSADLDKSMAIGIENHKLYSWIGEYKGLIKDSFMATFRFNLH